MDEPLPIGEELDFHYLLSLLPPLKSRSKFAWLPELFSIVGYEKLIQLCKYAGGEVIEIPTLDEVVHCIDALQYFYEIEILHKRPLSDVPIELRETYMDIQAVYSDVDKT